MFLDFEISPAFRLTQRRHLLAQMGHYCREAASLRDGNIAFRLAQTGSPPRVESPTLRVSGGQCMSG